MLHSTRILIPLLVICLLFTACGSANNQTNKEPQPPVQKLCPGIEASNPTCLTPYICVPFMELSRLSTKALQAKDKLSSISLPLTVPPSSKT